MTINVDGVWCVECNKRMSYVDSTCVKLRSMSKYYKLYACPICCCEVKLFRVVDFGRIKVRR